MSSFSIIIGHLNTNIILIYSRNMFIEIALMSYPGLNKTGLVQKLVMEKTSGIEFIKCLLKNELMKEFDNPGDKRSVLVAITTKGKQELALLMPEIGLVGSVAVGNLNPGAVRPLCFLLRKLDYYHSDISLHRRNLSLEELKNKI